MDGRTAAADLRWLGFCDAAGASTSLLTPPTHATRTASPTTARVRSGLVGPRLSLCGLCCVSWVPIPAARAFEAGCQLTNASKPTMLWPPVEQPNLPAGVRDNQMSYNDG